MPVIFKLFNVWLADGAVDLLPLHTPSAVDPLAVHDVALLVLVQLSVLDPLYPTESWLALRVTTGTGAGATVMLTTLATLVMPAAEVHVSV